MLGVVSGDHRCPEPNSTTARAPGCPRKKITFFSKRTTSHEKPKLVPQSWDPKVYCGIGLRFGGIRHLTFPLQLPVCYVKVDLCCEIPKIKIFQDVLMAGPTTPTLTNVTNISQQKMMKPYPGQMHN